MGRLKTYATLYERIVGNTHEPANDRACWTWAGSAWRGYPRVSVRPKGRSSPCSLRAHRVVLEELHGVEFPHDDAGHLCCNSLCVNPDHLEVQTVYHNLSERRGAYSPRKEGSMIPVLYPRDDPLQRAADAAWDAPFEPYHGEPPF